MTIRMAIPNKGRLNERAVQLLTRSGIELGVDWGRRLYVRAEKQDLEILFIRAQDIPEFVASGSIDFGITGEDMIAEAGYDIDSKKCELRKVLDLEFGKCRLSVAAPENGKFNSVDDIADGTRIATSFPYLTKKYFESKKKKVEVITISGAAEIMPYLGTADLIVDLVATGSTLKLNRLKEIGTIIESQAIVFASKSSLKKAGDCINDVVGAIKSVIDGEDKKYIMANVPRNKLSEVERILPGIGGPTVLEIAGNPDMVAVQAVIDISDMYKAVNDLKKLGATGILSLSIDRLVE